MAATARTVKPPRSRTDIPSGRRADVVNAGTMRPPTTVTISSTRSIPTCSACSARGALARSKATWKTRSQSHSSTSTSSSKRLRLRVRSSGSPTSTARSGRKARSTSAISAAGHSAELAISRRAASQVPASSMSGQPAKPFSPVQLGTAVSRNPAMALAMNPNSISCACHRVGGQAEPRDVPSAKFDAHTGTSSSAAQPASRN